MKDYWYQNIHLWMKIWGHRKCSDITSCRTNKTSRYKTWEGIWIRKTLFRLSGQFWFWTKLLTLSLQLGGAVLSLPVSWFQRIIRVHGDKSSGTPVLAAAHQVHRSDCRWPSPQSSSAPGRRQETVKSWILSAGNRAVRRRRRPDFRPRMFKVGPGAVCVPWAEFLRPAWSQIFLFFSNYYFPFKTSVLKCVHFKLYSESNTNV